MAVYAIGDVQGCLQPLQRLLDAIRFDPAADRLWFCGDLVNRGGQSLGVLRLIHSLDIHSTVVLGNHDLSLLAIAARPEADRRRTNAELQEVLFADDAPVLLDWLRSRPLVHVDAALGWMMVHAGLAPKWTPKIAQARSNEVQSRLSAPGHEKLLRAMFGNQPATWHPKLEGNDRLRAIINICTRMRFCSPKGTISFDHKGAPGSQKPGLYPWFDVPGHAKRELKIVCGHWSTLGLFMGLGVYAIDTGCVWGGNLTALRLDEELPQVFQVPGRPGGRDKG
jgi:bis(5'-nucleosyl)-tetraphosphatase (symmetrical)